MAEENVVPGNEGLPPAAPTAGDGTPPAASTGTTVATDAGSTPGSSTGGEQQTPVVKDTRLDAVLKALHPDGRPAAEAPPADASAVQDPGATDPAADPAVDADPDAGADAKLPFAQHPRFKQVLTQRARFKAEAEQHAAKVKDLEPKAKNYDSIVTYARNAGMTQEYVGDLFHMGKLMLDDPIAFHAAFKDKWGEIETLVGAKLPPDLQAQVTAGKVTPEVAKELALQRTRADLAEGRYKRSTEQTAAERQAQERQRQEQEIKEQTEAIGNSVSGWERQWKGTDPDYAIKQPYVRDRIAVKLNELAQKGELPSNAELLKLCSDVKDQVTKEMRSILPKRNGINPPPSGTTVVETTPAPGNRLQVAKAALERMTG